MEPLEKSYRLVILGLIGLMIMLIIILFTSCSTTRIPKTLDNVQVNSYLDSGQARLCAEYTVKVKMGNDSVTYFTYFVDKAYWFKLGAKEMQQGNKIY